MPQKFSPASQLELRKQAHIPPISLSFTFKCHASQPNRFLRNRSTWLGSEVGAQGWEEEDSFSGQRGFAFFHTRRQEGPESWGWDCSASCKGIQRSHCVWYFASQLASDSNIRRNRYLSSTSGKRHFLQRKKNPLLKTLKPNYSTSHSLKDWDLSDTVW